MVIEKEISSWQNFATLTSTHKSKSRFYRGLPNQPRKSIKEKWSAYRLLTTYQRRYSSPDILNFYYKLEDFQKNKEKYETLKNYTVGNSSNLLPLILYLRHAGIAMPVLDVTYDPLTALYFAVHNLYDQYGVRDTFESIRNMNREGYVSVYEFNIEILKTYYGASELHSVYKFRELIDDQVYLIEDVEDLSLKNPNMLRQDGAFLFYSSSYPIEIHLRNKRLLALGQGLEFPSPLIHHKISYSSIFTEWDAPNVYTYLESKGKVGYKLFADEQALLFDFINPSHSL